jgi:hypothetical protein
MTSDQQTASRPGLWIWLAAGLGSTGLVLVAVFGLAVAVLGASFTGCQTSDEPAGNVAGPAPSAYALASIPPERLALYENAGTRFNIDWSFLASIGAQECGNGECAGVNSSGCAGPMQIAYVRGSACSPGAGPTLWERYAVNADPGRPLSVNDPADAIYTAARILREGMGAPPTGGSFGEYRQAACSYYGACADSTVAYAEEVMARAVQYGFTGTGAPAATSPTLAQPVSTGGCEASVYLPEAGDANRIVKASSAKAKNLPALAARSTGRARNGAACSPPGCGSTRAYRSPAQRASTATRARSTPGREPTGMCSHPPQGPPQVMPSSTERAHARARMSGSSCASSKTDGSKRLRATTPARSAASARSHHPRQ